MTHEFDYEPETELVVKCPVCKDMIVITYTFHPKWIKLKERKAILLLKLLKLF